MKSEIQGSPAFSHVHVDLEPGESVVAESGAMASMGSSIELKARMNGSFFSALGRKFFGGETFFIGKFSNPSGQTQRLTLTQKVPGEIHEVELNGNALCLQPGAFLAATEGVRLGLKWAGLASFIGKEGLFKLEVSGQGKVWYGAFGGLVQREVNGSLIVDTSHLVAYDPSLTLHMQLSGGLFSSFFSGEGLVTRLEGQGKVILQTRSIAGMRDWLNPLVSG